jgi:hypothetical protein
MHPLFRKEEKSAVSVAIGLICRTLYQTPNFTAIMDFPEFLKALARPHAPSVKWLNSNFGFKYSIQKQTVKDMLRGVIWQYCRLKELKN